MYNQFSRKIPIVFAEFGSFHSSGIRLKEDKAVHLETSRETRRTGI